MQHFFTLLVGTGDVSGLMNTVAIEWKMDQLVQQWITY